jgi:anti-anti-sigma factor
LRNLTTRLRPKRRDFDAVPTDPTARRRIRAPASFATLSSMTATEEMPGLLERPTALGMTVRRHNGVAILELDGELDVSGVVALRRQLEQLVIEGETRILVDLICLSFLESTGVRVLVANAKRIAGDGEQFSDGRIAIAGARGPVAKVLSITDPDGDLVVFTNAEYALRWLREGLPT